MVERVIVGEMYTNTYIFSAWHKKCIIIDPGSDFNKILTQLKLKNLKPFAIVCTHGHLDHIAALPEIVNYYKEIGIKINISIHKKDKNYLGKNAKETHNESFTELGPPGLIYLDKNFKEMPKADFLLNDGDLVPETNLRVIHTPGHTPGGICLYSESEKILFSGDTLFSEGIGRTDLKGGDFDTLKKSIIEKLFKLPGETRVFSGHGPPSDINREKRSNPFLINYEKV